MVILSRSLLPYILISVHDHNRAFQIFRFQYEDVRKVCKCLRNISFHCRTSLSITRLMCHSILCDVQLYVSLQKNSRIKDGNK